MSVPWPCSGRARAPARRGAPFALGHPGESPQVHARPVDDGPSWVRLAAGSSGDLRKGGGGSGRWASHPDSIAPNLPGFGTTELGFGRAEVTPVVWPNLVPMLATFGYKLRQLLSGCGPSSRLGTSKSPSPASHGAGTESRPKPSVVKPIPATLWLAHPLDLGPTSPAVPIDLRQNSPPPPDGPEGPSASEPPGLRGRARQQHPPRRERRLARRGPPWVCPRGWCMGSSVGCRAGTRLARMPSPKSDA